MSKSTIPAVKAFTEKWDSKVMNAEEAFKEFEEKHNYLGCNEPNYVAGYRDGYNAAKPEIDKLKLKIEEAKNCLVCVGIGDAVEICQNTLDILNIPPEQ